MKKIIIAYIVLGVIYVITAYYICFSRANNETIMATVLTGILYIYCFSRSVDICRSQNKQTIVYSSKDITPYYAKCGGMYKRY